MTSLTTAASVATLVVTGLLVALLLAVAGVHARRTRTQARDARRRAALTPVVHALLDDDPDDDRHDSPDDGAVPHPADPLLDELVLDLLPQLRGADRLALQRVLETRGVVDRAAADLTARAAWRRGRAAVLLGSAAGTRHTATVAGLLRDPSPDVRCAAARALGKAGDPTATAALLAALSADPPVPPGIVGMALLDLGTPAIPELRHALAAGAPAVRAVAAELLGLHGDLPATIPLAAVLCDPRQPAHVRAAAAGALGRIGDPRATRALAHVLTTDAVVTVQRAAAEALGRVGDPAALDALSGGLEHPDLAVRGAAADALVQLGAVGRGRLSAAAAGTGPAAEAAAGALDALRVSSSRARSVPA